MKNSKTTNPIPKKNRMSYPKLQLLFKFSLPNLTWINTMILIMRVSEILYGLEPLMKDDTGVLLEGWMDARNTKNQYRNQLRNFSKVWAPKCYIQLLTRKFKTDSIKTICRPMAMTTSRNWKFGTRKDGDVEAEEVVLCIQGIICNQDLPPIQPFKV